MNREERIYSVTMTEDELRLFSEFLEQRGFADKHEEQRLLKLRYEDPDKYLEQVREYRKNQKMRSKWEEDLDRRDYRRKVGAAAAALGAVGGISTAYDWHDADGNLQEGTGKPIGGALLGAAALYPVGLLAGRVSQSAVSTAKRILDNRKYSPKKTAQDEAEIKEEKRLKDNNPEAYDQIKQRQADNIKVIDKEMTKKEFKEKWGKRPRTKL